MQRIASRIEAVTVYRAGALVTRVAVLEGEALAALASGATSAGLGEFQLVNLPLSLEDGSVRVRFEPCASASDAAARAALPVAVDARVALDVPEVAESPEPARSEALRAALIEEERVRDQIAQVERALERIAALELAPRPEGEEGAPPPASPMASRLAMLSFRSERQSALGARKRELQDDLRRASERRAELEERERRASSARQIEEHELRKSVVVRVRAGQAQAARLVLSYHVPGARWAPAYSIRFDRSLREADLSMRAVVCQGTGEDWSGVSLLLSTAQPQRWTELPELRSIRIGRMQPPPARTGWRPPPDDRDALYGDYDRAFGPPAPAGAGVGGRAGAAARPAPTGEVAAAYDEGHTTGMYQAPADAYADKFQESLGGDFDDEMDEAPARYDEGQTSPARGGIPGTFREGDTQPARVPPMPPAMARSSAPPPPPQAAPFMDIARSKKMKPEAPMPKRRRSFTAPAPGAALFGSVADGGGGSATEIMATAELRVASELLAYGSLRMPPPGAGGRGKLAPASGGELYLRELSRLEVRISVDVFAAIAHAAEHARSVVRKPLPPRHAVPRDEDGFDYAYPAEAPVDIPSDRSFHALPLSQHKVSGRSRYVVVPRETRDVFRFVEIASPLSAPLLPGPADVYIGEDFLVTTDVRATPPRGSLRLGLGVEQGIKVSRNTSFEERATGLMRGSLALRHHIRIEVANRLERAALVEVRERIPVPAIEDDSDVEVAALEASPPWQPYEQEDAPVRGAHYWLVELAPGEEQPLSAHYEVRIAGKHELVGGNRREA
ncbi:mucoidy inhibitor MuiA family protein [Haliangium ochraceum]|uniref:DUF4139 domain-containing protein n=1 Tax=Haliangium ochraceum (strain DSM 14365 / JCM 11303 / SMP-2) TaxID=502025 RepID=D0LFR6_HALO1|nr:mucoidy inhibitor MuiA family protein [Haliangium ochraceum]ACY14518.1 conserved hypothetical protein [Haliangium ochraceum DSM 14365]